MITVPPPDKSGRTFEGLNVGDTAFYNEEQSGAQIAFIKIRWVAQILSNGGQQFNAVELNSGYLIEVPPTAVVRPFNAKLTYV